MYTSCSASQRETVHQPRRHIRRVRGRRRRGAGARVSVLLRSTEKHRKSGRSWHGDLHGPDVRVDGQAVESRIGAGHRRQASIVILTIYYGNVYGLTRLCAYFYSIFSDLRHDYVVMKTATYIGEHSAGMTHNKTRELHL